MPERGRARAGRPRRGRLLLRPARWRRARRRRHGRTTGRACGRSTSAGRRASCRPRCPGSTRSGCASSPTTSPTPPRPTSPRRFERLRGDGARRPRRARLVPRRATGATGGSRCWPTQALPHSLGLMYEELTEHLGFRRSSRRVQGDGARLLRRARWRSPPLPAGRARDGRTAASPSRRSTGRRRIGECASTADLAASVQAPPRGGAARARRLAARGAPARTRLALAGGVALNCVANSRLAEHGPFRDVWVQPAAGDAGTALGAALHVAHGLGDDVRPMRTAALGREWSDEELGADPRARRGVAVRAAGRHRRRRRRGARRGRGRRLVPGPQRVRPAGARPSQPARQPARPTTSSGSTTSRAASSSGRSRPWCSPSGRPRSSRGRCRARTCSSPTACGPAGRDRIPAVVHVDGTARIQTVDRGERAAGGADAAEASSGAPACPCRQHEPQHRRPADGGRPPRRARVLRLGAGRRARDRPVPRRAGRLHGRAAVTTVDVVSRRVGRPSLRRCSRRSAAARARAWPRDRRRRPPAGVPEPALDSRSRRPRRARCAVVRGRGAGPAAARNIGWRAGRRAVGRVPRRRRRPGARLARAPGRRPRRAAAGRRRRARGGSTCRCRPTGARPTGSATSPASRRARWATADMAYRRAAARRRRRLRRALPARLPRGRRPRACASTAAGGRLVAAGAGGRAPGPAGRPAGLAAPPGRQRRRRPDAAPSTGAAGASAPARRAAAGRATSRRAAAGCGGRGSPLLGRAAAPGGRARRRLARGHGRAGARRRIAPGPRTPREVATMAATSAAHPAAATWLARGLLRRRRLLADRAAHRGRGAAPRPSAVLLDRDGTLVEDVPYNGDPALVRPCRGRARRSSGCARAGIPTAVVSNQSGVARGLLTPEEVAAVNGRVEELLGAARPVVGLPARAGRRLRLPQAGSRAVLDAAARAGRGRPSRCAVVGDIGADVDAARAAGARAVLVPTARTRRPRWSRRRVVVAPDLRRRGRAAAGGAAVTRPRASSSGSTTTATCCSPAPRSGRSPPAPDRVTLLVRPARAGRPPRCCPASTRCSSGALPWIDPEPGPGRPGRRARRWSRAIAERAPDEADRPHLVPPEPAAAALVLRLAGVPRIAAISADYPGSLLDVRHRVDDDVHEVERSLVAAGRAPATTCRPATTGGCRDPVPPAGGRLRRRLRRRPPRRLGARPRLGPASRTAARRAAAARGPRRRRHRRPGRAGAHRRVAGRRARASSTSAAATTLAELAGVLAGARARRRRQHRPRAPGRGRRRPRSSRCSRRRSRPCAGVPGGCRTCCSATSTCPARAAARGSARCRATRASTVRRSRRSSRPSSAWRAAEPVAERGGLSVLVWHVHGAWTTALRPGPARVPGPGPAGPRPRRPRPGADLRPGPARPWRCAAELARDAEVDVVVAPAPGGRGAGRALARPPPRAATCPPSTSSTTRRRAASTTCATRPPTGPTSRSSTSRTSTRSSGTPARRPRA